jgi:hypothetical protein
LRTRCGHFWNWVVAREKPSVTTMSTKLPADLIERVQLYGTAEDLSPSAVIERAILLMFMEPSDETLGDTLREAQYSIQSCVHVASDVHEITVHELIEEHVHADKSPDGGFVF